MKTTKVSDKIYFFTDDSIFQDYCNSSVILTSDGPVIIDTFASRAQFDTVYNFIKDRGYSQPAAIIYTHGHIDHVLGNQQDFTCPVYAHENIVISLKDIEDNTLPGIIEAGYLPQDTKVIYPNATFKDKFKLEIGGFEFDLMHNPGHTEDSIIIYEQTTGTIFAGDTLFGKEDHVAIPYLDLENGLDKSEILKSIESIKSLTPCLIVPGHGYNTIPEDYFLTIDNYIFCLAAKAGECCNRGFTIEDLDSIVPQEVFNSDIIDKCCNLDEKFSSFNHNLKEAYKMTCK